MPLVSLTPLLLIDVDGVLNPHVRPGTTPGAQYATHRIGEQVVRLTPSHGEWLHRLAELYELAWATTWEADANALIGPIIGAPPNLPVLSLTDRDAKDWTWKLPAVERFVADRPRRRMGGRSCDPDSPRQAGWIRRLDRSGIQRAL